MDLPSLICNVSSRSNSLNNCFRTVKDTPPASAIETPPGKNQDNENFPVGSWLLPAHLRPHITTFYRFARTIDDIADAQSLVADEKLERLCLFEETLMGNISGRRGYEKGDAMRSSLLKSNISVQHCLDLITAFKRDATKLRYADWPDLLDYCTYSACPVGRYLIDLHGGDKKDYPPSDALCSALQILNHLQDCKEDFEKLGRVYLPLDSLQKHNVPVSDLSAVSSSQGLRRVKLDLLRKTASLIEESRPLTSRLKSRRLAMEAQTIINIAKCLKSELTLRDPLAERVQLSKWQYVWSFIVGVIEATTTQQHST